MPSRTSPILVTGCSSGIGRATAARLARAGHLVYASARRPESLIELQDIGCRTLRLDLTDPESMIQAVKTLHQRHGHIAALINNAGYAEIETPYRAQLYDGFHATLQGVLARDGHPHHNLRPTRSAASARCCSPTCPRSQTPLPSPSSAPSPPGVFGPATACRRTHTSPSPPACSSRTGSGDAAVRTLFLGASAPSTSLLSPANSMPSPANRVGLLGSSPVPKRVRLRPTGRLERRHVMSVSTLRGDRDRNSRQILSPVWRLPDIVARH